MWDDRQREAFGDAVINTIAEYAPNIKDIILHRQVLTPLDIERDFGLTEGNIFQGELTLEQLFFLRPVPGWAQYSTPIDSPVHVRLGDASRRRHHGRARHATPRSASSRCRDDPSTSLRARPRYDAIVIGGGVNGLTCATLLAKNGIHTLLLEQRAELGRVRQRRRDRSRLQGADAGACDRPGAA